MYFSAGQLKDYKSYTVLYNTEPTQQNCVSVQIIYGYTLCHRDTDLKSMLQIESNM